jgi:hypothetical protein
MVTHIDEDMDKGSFSTVDVNWYSQLFIVVLGVHCDIYKSSYNISQ